MYFYFYIYINTHARAHVIVHKSCILKNNVGYRCASIRIQSLTFQLERFNIQQFYTVP